MIKKHKNSLFVSFLISYLIVMLVPAVLIYTLYTLQMTKIVREEILSSVYLDQQYAVRLLDDQLLHLDNTADQFQLTRGFRSYLDTGNFYSSESGETYGEIIEDIFALHRMNSLAENFFVYFYDEDCAFSADGLHQIDTFVTTDYRCENYTPKEFLSILRQVKAPMLLPAQQMSIHEKSDEYITFIYPLSKSFGQNTAAAIFCISTDRITDLFSERLTDYNASTYFWDDDGQIILSHNPTKDTEDCLRAQTASGSTAFAKQYHIISGGPTRNGWHYMTLLPKKQEIFSDVFQTSQHFVLYTVLALLFSGIVVFFMMRFNYNPIRKLQEKASRLSSDDDSTELDTISNALDYLHEQNDILSVTVVNNLTLIKNNRLRRLLTGEYSSIEKFNEDCRELNLQYSCNNFFVAVVMFHCDGEPSADVADTVRETLAKKFESHYIYNLEPDRIITINCIEKDCTATILDAYRNMLKIVHNKYGFSATVGIGRIYVGAADIGKSYVEARSAIDYRFVKGNNTIILYDDIYGDAGALPAYPYNDFEKLKNAVSADDNDGMTRQINSLLSYITDNNLPLFLARGVCFDILKTVGEVAGDKKNFTFLQGFSLFDLANMETAQDLLHMIEELRARLDDGSSADSNDRRLLEHMMDELRANCMRCDFSIQELSGNIGMLPSNLSTFFKNQTGSGILDFVIDLRMERAKELLCDSDFTLSEIGLQVGYYNASSFIRRFKEHQGITPGSYRSLHRNRCRP